MEMGVPGLRGVASCPSVVVQEDTVHQGSVEHVPTKLMGIVKKLCLPGRVCNDL